MSTHSPEPWIAGTMYDRIEIEDDNDRCPIAEIFERADRDRIVACVNAMAGVEDPAAWVAHAKAAEKHRHEIAAHQDNITELLEAAKEMQGDSGLHSPEEDNGCDECARLASLHAAIRKLDPTWNP